MRHVVAQEELGKSRDERRRRHLVIVHIQDPPASARAKEPRDRPVGGGNGRKCEQPVGDGRDSGPDRVEPGRVDGEHDLVRYLPERREHPGEEVGPPARCHAADGERYGPAPQANGLLPPQFGEGHRPTMAL